MRPMISYYGGKQRIVRHIVDLLPSHKVYVEPFAGGATVLFAKRIPKPTAYDNYREVINDKWEFLVNFYRVAKDANTRPELINLLRATPFSYSEFKRSQKIYIDNECYTNVEKAWACFMLSHCSFACKMSKSGGWQFGKKGQNQPYKFQNKLQILDRQCDRLSKVYIENRDAIKIIELWDSTDTLFYCDPPYINSDQGHYNGYTANDFQKLIDSLQNVKGQFILSSYPTDMCPESWSRKEIKATISAGSKKNITNIDPKLRERTEVLFYKFHDDKKSQLEWC